MKILKYLTNSQYRRKIDAASKFSNTRPRSYSYSQKQNGEMELGRKTLPSKQEQEQRKGGTTIGRPERLVRIRDFKFVYRNEGICFQGINIRNNEVVARGFETKIKGEETPRGVEAKKIIDAFVEENGLKWQTTRQLGINTDIAGDGFLELYKDETLMHKPSKGWRVVLLDPETVDFDRDRNGKIKLDRDITSPKYGHPLGYVFIEDPDQPDKTKPLDWNRVIHLVYNKIGGEMIGTSTLQPIYGTAERVVNIDAGYAEAAYRGGYPQRIIGVGTPEEGATEQMMDDAEVIAKDMASQDIVIYDISKYKIDILPTQQIDPSISMNYFLNKEITVFGIPKYQLLGTAAGEGNRAVSETMAKDRASMINTMQLSVNESYEKQMFRRILDAEAYADQTIEIVWNPIIEEDKSEEIERIISLHKNQIITTIEARSLLSDFIGIIKGNIGPLQPVASQQSPFGQQDTFNQSFAMPSVKQVSMKLQALTEADRIERNKIVNMDFEKVSNEMAEFTNSLRTYYEHMRRRLSLLFEEKKSVISENVAIDGIKQILTNHISRIYTLGYSQGSNKVKGKREKKLQDIPNEIMSMVSAYATTIALKESTELVNAVNIQIALGLSAGESIPDIKKRIATAFEKFGGTTGRFKEVTSRAELIARTETQKIVNQARLEAYKDAAVERYEWLAVIDDRTDWECVELNGRIFEVGNGPLPISGTHIGCRCTILPVI